MPRKNPIEHMMERKAGAESAPMKMPLKKGKKNKKGKECS